MFEQPDNHALTDITLTGELDRLERVADLLNGATPDLDEPPITEPSSVSDDVSDWDDWDDLGGFSMSA